MNFDTRWRRYKMFLFNVKFSNEIEIYLPFSFYPPKFCCCPPFGEGKCRQSHKNDNYEETNGKAGRGIAHLTKRHL